MTKNNETAAPAAANENLSIFSQVRTVPEQYLRDFPVSKGKTLTDINPTWRIETLTQLFGPCGKGWFLSDVKFWSEQLDGKVMTFCNLNLNIIDPHTHEKWNPIFGHGGNSMSKQGDEAYKCAMTDAISVACKQLGFAADIYYGHEVTKYDQVMQSYVPWGFVGNGQPQPLPQPQPQQIMAPQVPVQVQAPLPPAAPVRTAYDVCQNFCNAKNCDYNLGTHPQCASAMQSSGLNQPMPAAPPAQTAPMPMKATLQEGTREYTSVLTQMITSRGLKPIDIYRRITEKYNLNDTTWQKLCQTANINPSFN